DALLVRRTHAGTDRAGGGAYERVFLALYVFGADGLVTRIEFFDTDREDQALARFDELTAEPATPRIANAETRRNDRLREAWAARASSWPIGTSGRARASCCGSERPTSTATARRWSRWTRTISTPPTPSSITVTLRAKPQPSRSPCAGHLHAGEPSRTGTRRRSLRCA